MLHFFLRDEIVNQNINKYGNYINTKNLYIELNH